MTNAMQHLSPKTVLAKKDGWKKLTNAQAYELVAEYVERYGREYADMLAMDWGKNVMPKLLDMVWFYNEYELKAK